jgi:hypothetical protein
MTLSEWQAISEGKRLAEVPALAPKAAAAVARWRRLQVQYPEI